jgi:CHASE2 domain-containing sensor protein
MSAVVETRPQGKPIGAWYNGAAVVGGLLALFALFLVPTIEPALLRAEHWAADWRTAWLSERLPSSHPKVAIVRITEESVADFPYFLPVNRGYFADIIDAVDKAGAKAIGLDFYFTRDTEKKFDDKLHETLRRLKTKLVVGALERRLRPRQLEYQHEFIGDTPAGYIDLRRETDHVVRYRASPASEGRYQESFSTRLARAGGWTGTPPPPERIGWLLPPTDGSGTFLAVKAHDLKTKLGQNPDLLKDRIVLIGGDLYSLDLHWTPLSIRGGKQTVGVEVHAQMVAELLDRTRSRHELEPPTRTGFLLALSALGIFLGLRFQERKFDFLDWRVVSFGVIAVDLLSFKYLYLVLPFTHAAIAWGAAVTTGTHLPRANAWVRGRRKPA